MCSVRVRQSFHGQLLSSSITMLDVPILCNLVGFEQIRREYGPKRTAEEGALPAVPTKRVRANTPYELILNLHVNILIYHYAVRRVREWAPHRRIVFRAEFRSRRGITDPIRRRFAKRKLRRSPATRECR